MYQYRITECVEINELSGKIITVWRLERKVMNFFWKKTKIFSFKGIYDVKDEIRQYIRDIERDIEDRKKLSKKVVEEFILDVKIK